MFFAVYDSDLTLMSWNDYTHILRSIHSTRMTYTRSEPPALVSHFAKTTLFRRVPIPEIDTSICVPGTRYLGGFKPAPTPRDSPN